MWGEVGRHQLKLSAVLRVGDEQTELEREHAHPEQPLRRVAVHDALRDALGDRSLADALQAVRGVSK